MCEWIIDNSADNAASINSRKDNVTPASTRLVVPEGDELHKMIACEVMLGAMRGKDMRESATRQLLDEYSAIVDTQFIPVEKPSHFSGHE